MKNDFVSAEQAARERLAMEEVMKWTNIGSRNVHLYEGRPIASDASGARWSGDTWVGLASVLGIEVPEPCTDERASSEELLESCDRVLDGARVVLERALAAARTRNHPERQETLTGGISGDLAGATELIRSSSLQDRINKLESELSRWRFLGQEIVLGKTATDLFEVTPERCREKLKANGSSSVQVTYRVAYGSVLLNSGEVLDRVGNLLRIVKRDVDGRGPQAIVQYGNHEGPLLADMLALAADRRLMPGRCVSPKSKLDTSEHALIRLLTEHYGSRCGDVRTVPAMRTVLSQVVRVIDFYQQELAESAKLEKESDR